jgi:isoquinoline 1-oxidoreductase beta subunit
MAQLKRRHFILGTLAVGGALAVGWLAAPPRQRLTGARPLPTGPGQTPLNGWVKVGRDGTVTVMMSQAEMGQGSHTGIAMLLAEELDADWATVRLEQAPYDSIYNNIAAVADSLPFEADDHGIVRRATLHAVRRILRELPGLAGTGGSSSIRDQWLPLRQAGASARLMLIAAAARRWQVPPAECSTDAGVVHHASGRHAAYGELAADAARESLPLDPPLKSAAQFRLIGTELPRLDSRAKVNGTAAYAIDARPPALLHACLALCPTVGGRAASFDARAALAMPGVHNVVALEPVNGSLAGTGTIAGGVAVIADNHWRAKQALGALHIQWDRGTATGLSSNALVAELRQALDAGKASTHLVRGDTAAALRSAARTVTAEYQVPFLAHATMEPMNCTVRLANGRATVWAATQAPGLARAAAAKALGIAASKVEVKVPFLGGGFGRRYLSDCIVQAAQLARITGGAPVQLLWPREEDMTHDFYRPAFVCRCRAGFDARGALIAWELTSAGSNLGAPAFIGASSDGAATTPYQVPNLRIAHAAVENPVTMGIWRSVANSQNAFFVESFMDELAASAGSDPLAFRIALLAGRARELRVLERVAAASGWGMTPASPDGSRRARGLALHRCFGSAVAQVAEVSLTDAHGIRVHSVTCVIDCGLAVNRNLIRQQIEGGTVFGLSAALYGEITLEHGEVQQTNFHQYRPVRMAECPEVSTIILADGTEPGGVGEVATPPIAPAVANAVFALTGQRLRSLPLTLG